MPPKGSDNNSKGGIHNKQAARIKKPSLQTLNNSKGKGNTRGGLRGNSRSTFRGGRSVADEDDTNNDLNNSIEPEVSTPKEENSWLNNLPPVIKPDEELHVKLLKERKEKDEKKHFDFCQSELKAMLNIALFEVDIPSDDRDKFMQKTKVDYFNGLYHDPINNTPRTPKSNNASSQTMMNKNENEINNKDSDFYQLKQSIHQLIDSNPISVEEAFKYFNLQSEASEFFDINPELNKTFSLIHNEMQPYKNQNDTNELLNFPFLICIVGPPCSGKSTICQFIASHFDVHIINIVDPDSIPKTITPAPISNPNSDESSKEIPNTDQTADSTVEKENDSNENINSIKNPFVICSSDDKAIINSIITEISELPENKGVIIVNYPDTKVQLTQFEKALQIAMKKKGDGKIRTLNGLIRASMTAEEAARQVQKRLIDKNTNLVFHPIFNPPDFSPNIKFNTEPYPHQISSNLSSTRNSAQTPKGNLNSKNSKNNMNINNIDKSSLNITLHPVMETYSDLAPIYSKINSQLSVLDNLMKKIGPSVSIGFCNYIGQLNLLIESFLKSVYKSKNIDPPFTSFVIFETQDQFYYSKLCYDIFQIWHNECIPQFGKQISTICSRLKSSESQIEYLLDISMQMFSLIISRQDDRKAKTIEFIKSQDEIRDKIRQLQLIKEEKESKKRAKQSSQSNTNEVVMIKPRANTSIASRNLCTTPIKQKREKAIMTMRTRNLYLRNVFPNVNISELENNRNVQLKTPDSLTFKIKRIQTTPTRNRNGRPYTAISDIHKNLNLNSVFDSDLNKIDTDKEIEKEEAKLFELQINFYHFIWQQTIELRNRNSAIVDRFIRRSPIKAFKGVMEENEKVIFDSLLKRFFLVDWFSSHLSPLLEKKENDETSTSTTTTNISNTINQTGTNFSSNNSSMLSIPMKSQRQNFRQGSKMNLFSESLLLEQFDNSSNVVNKYNITDFPHPTVPDYNPSNLKDLCSLMRVDYIDCEEDNPLRLTKSSEVIKSTKNSLPKPLGIEKKNNSDENFSSSDSNSFSYLMTPSNRPNNMSKTPTTATNVWELNPPPTVAKVAASSRIISNGNENQFERGKKKFYFPPNISFDPSHSSFLSSRISSRTVMSTHSEKVEIINDEFEEKMYSNSSYSYEINEEEEEEIDSDKNMADKLPFPFHFPEWRKCNRSTRNQIESSFSSLSSIEKNNQKSKKKNIKKDEILINNFADNDQQNNENKKNNCHTLSSHRHHHHQSKEDAIKNFLSYLQNEMDDQILKPEAKVMLDIFLHFIENKNQIDGQIDSELKILRENLKKMVHQKCAKEMESFSRRFRYYRDRVDLQLKNLKKEQQFQIQPILDDDKIQKNFDVDDKKIEISINKENEPDFDFDIDNLESDSLLPFDTSFMTNRCIEIFNALDLKSLTSFFDEDDENDENSKNIETSKLQRLYSYYYNECIMKKTKEDTQSIDDKNESNNDISKINVEEVTDKIKVEDLKDNINDVDIVDVPDCFISLNDLYIAMDSFGFTEKEKWFVEANVRMKTIPEFINILYFIRSLLPKGESPFIDQDLPIPKTYDNNINSQIYPNSIVTDQN